MSKDDCEPSARRFLPGVEGHFFFNASDLKVAADEQLRGRLKLEPDDQQNPASGRDLRGGPGATGDPVRMIAGPLPQHICSRPAAG